MLLQPRRNHDRRIRRKRFRSVFSRSPVSPPFRWFLSSQEFADARGVKLRTVAAWRSVWRKNGFQSGPDARPVQIPPSKEWVYRWNDVTGGDFVAELRAERWKLIEATSVRDGRYNRNKSQQARRTAGA